MRFTFALSKKGSEPSFAISTSEERGAIGGGGGGCLFSMPAASTAFLLPRGGGGGGLIIFKQVLVCKQLVGFGVHQRERSALQLSRPLTSLPTHPLVHCLRTPCLLHEARVYAWGVSQAVSLTCTLALPPAAPILPAILPKRAAGSTCHPNVRDGSTLDGHKTSPLPGIKRTRTEFHCCCVSCTDGGTCTTSSSPARPGQHHAVGR